MKKAYIAFLIGAFCLVFVVPPLITHAQSSKATAQPKKNSTVGPTPITPPEQPTVGIDLTLSPVFLSMVTDPGKEVTATVKITNNNNITEYLQAQLVRLATDQQGEITLLDVEPNDAFKSWLSFSDEQFVIGPTETKIIKVTVDPPSDAALGYYYAVLISRIGENKAGERESLVAGSPALPLLLEVKSPNAKREAQLVDFTADSMFYEYLPTTFSIKVRNTGNIHVSPLGTIFIDWGNKKNIANIVVNEGKGNVLPDSERSFTAAWDDGMIVRVPKVENGKEVTDEKGMPVYETKFDLDKPLSTFRIGKYTANLLLIYDNGERDVPMEAQVSFWVIPWKLILGLVAIILAPVFLFYLVSRVRKRRKK